MRGTTNFVSELFSSFFEGRWEMEIPKEQAQAGDSIAWEKGGAVAGILGFVLSLFDSSYRKRKWKAWHTGYIVKILPDGEVVTSQAIGSGVHTVTYSSIDDLAECKFYRWLSGPNQDRIEDYTGAHEREKYDVIGYLWDALGNFSMYVFHYTFRVVDNQKFCWEHVSEFNRYMGREIQPECEPCNIARMMNILEG
jgi:hypothetical protein